MGKKKGGAFLASGNNTCVFDPPVKCADKSTPVGNFVSRIVPADSVDLIKQKEVKKAFASLDPRYVKNFNLFEDACNAEFRPEDEPDKCDVSTLRGNLKLGSTRLINIITPKQDGDINITTDNPESIGLRKSEAVTLTAMKELFLAIIEMNSFRVQVFHTDAHLGNISWKGENIVLHDWEKATIGDEELWKSLSGQFWGEFIGIQLIIKNLNENADDAKAVAIDAGEKNPDAIVAVGNAATAEWVTNPENTRGVTPAAQERLEKFETLTWWKNLLILLENTTWDQRYDAGKEIPPVLEIAFRFWDIMSILPVCRSMFHTFTVKDGVKMVEIPILVGVEETLKRYWKELEPKIIKLKTFGWNAEKKGVFLEKITVNLKKIIGDCWDLPRPPAGASRTRRRNARSYPKRSGQRRALNTRKPSFRRS